MKDILAMPLSFKVKLLLKIYVRKCFNNLVVEIKLKYSLKAGFSIQGIED